MRLFSPALPPFTPPLHLSEALTGEDLKTLILSPERKALISSPVFLKFLTCIYPHCMWRKVQDREGISVASLWWGETRQEHPEIHPGVLHRNSSWLEQPLCERRASAGARGAEGGVPASPQMAAVTQHPLCQQQCGSIK